MAKDGSTMPNGRGPFSVAPAKPVVDQEKATGDNDITLPHDPDLVNSAIEEAMALARAEAASEGQLRTLLGKLQVLGVLAELGIGAAKHLGGAKNGKTPGHGANVLVAFITALACTLGVPLVREDADNADDQLAKEIVERLNAQEERHEALRMSLGKTIEWSTNEVYKDCLNNQQLAKSMNFLASQQPDAEKYTPINIVCDQSPRLPMDMAILLDLAASTNTTTPK